MPDLISRDKLIISMKKTKDVVMRTFPFPKEQINIAEAVADAMLYNARNAPAVDAVPVEHGHWEIAIGYDPKRVVKCSVCNLMAFEPSDFCPHCGAKMDGKDSE